MKKTIIFTILATSIPLANAAVLQTMAGPFTATLGSDVTIVDTTTDTGNWIDDLNDGGTVFVGFDWTISNNDGETGAGGFFGGLSVRDGGTERLLIGNQWAPLTYGGGSLGFGDETSTSYVVGQTVHLVFELTVADGGVGDDTWKMWIDPSSGDFASHDAIRTDWTIDNITGFTSRAGNGTGAATVADVIVATTFADAVAVPEPSSSALLGLGGLALILRRRK